MTDFILFLIFGLVVFSLSLVCYEKYKMTTLYALAIGGLVNSNFFHSFSHPIECFGLPFGIDSIIYTLFAFCVMVVLIQCNRREAYLLAFSSIIAILFSGTMQLVSELFTIGMTEDVIGSFLYFASGAVVSVIAVVIAIEIVCRLKEKRNPYFCIIIGVIIITSINGLTYLSLSYLNNVSFENMGKYFGALFCGKAIAVLFSILTFFFIQLREKRLSQKKAVQK